MKRVGERARKNRCIRVTILSTVWDSMDDNSSGSGRATAGCWLSKIEEISTSTLRYNSEFDEETPYYSPCSKIWFEI